MMTENRDWTAFHIFLHDGKQQEAFLADWLLPEARKIVKAGQAEQWFFLRYWDGGPHIRIRFLNLQNRSVLLNSIQDVANGYLGKEALTADAFYGNHAFDGQPVNKAELDWHRDGQVVCYPYCPEYARYGGEKAIAVSEDLFHASSDIASAIIKATEYNNEHRFQLALKLMVTSVWAVKPDRKTLQQFCHFYSGFWRGHASAAGIDKAPEHGAALSHTLTNLQANISAGRLTGIEQAWVEQVQNGVNALSELSALRQLYSPINGKLVESDADLQAAILSIIGSHVHMTNNRLGVTPVHEFVIASQIASALAELDLVKGAAHV